jgi:hypothetical protein
LLAVPAADGFTAELVELVELLITQANLLVPEQITQSQ